MQRLALIFGLLLALAAVPFLVAPLSNNHSLNRLEQRFLALKHPARSELVLRFSKVGLVHHGNGNNCSYVVGELRSAPGDLGPILSTYAGYEIAAVGGENFRRERNCRVQAKAVDGNFVETGADMFAFFDAEIMKEVSSRARGRSDVYFVACADTGYAAGFDLRCR